MRKYFRTGDIGMLKAGELFVVGRLKDTLVIRGLKYQPEDIEYIIIASHPSLRSAACVAFTIDHGHGEQLVILQEMKKTAYAYAEEIRGCIKNSVYEAFGLAVLDTILLPQGKISKTTSGKIMRNDNRTKYLQGEFSESL